MKIIETELALRKEEIESVISFLQVIENGELVNSEEIVNRTGVQTSLKAGIVLMLYNVVESIVTKCLEKVHKIIIENNLNYDQCNEELRKLVVVYYENAQLKSGNIHKKVPYILGLYEYVGRNGTFNLTYEEMSKCYSLYSGNLDAKAIKSVLGKYGIQFNEQVTELQTIKNDRNKLAHGEMSFEEVGRELSSQQLVHMEERTFEYMNTMISKIKEYIKQKGYIGS